MEAYFETLLTIYSIVKSESSPETYLCTPHEIILRQSQDWTTIQGHLDQLEKETFINVKHLDKIAVCITSKGIEKSKTLKNNFVSNNFSFSNEQAALVTKDLQVKIE
ncbi:MAG: hypothetical protein LH478_12425 [Chitinophagaceae bacterium]|nr:hypothetical protein [Chitinophagaceae bacterium]